MSKIIGIILTTLFGATFFVVAANALSIPDVHVSYKTNECVKVINFGEDSYSCDNLPTRYNQVWVQ